MNIQTLAPILAAHPFFHGLDDAYIALIAGCAKNVRFAANERIFSENQEANWFYLLRAGRIAVEVAVPGRGAAVVQTVDEGEVLGWSWLFPPYKWNVSARAVETTRALAMDGACLRAKCDDDPKLGYQLMKRFSGAMVQRLQATRLLLLDVYGTGSR